MINQIILEKVISKVYALNQDQILFFYKKSTIANIFDVMKLNHIAELDIGNDFNQDNCYAISQDVIILAIHDKNSSIILWNIEKKKRIVININFSLIGCVGDNMIGYQNKNIIIISHVGKYTQNPIYIQHLIMKLICNRVTFLNDKETLFYNPFMTKQQFRLKQKIKYNQIHSLSSNIFCVLSNDQNKFFIINYLRLKIIRKIKQPITDDQYYILGVVQSQIFFRILTAENDFLLWTSNLDLLNKFNHTKFQNTISESVIQNKFIFFKNFILTWNQNQFRRVFYK